MLGNSSFSQYGAKPKNPISGINNFLNKQFGVPIPVAPKHISPTQPAQPNMSVAPKQPTLGTNPGVLKSTAPVAKTVDPAGNTTHYATKPNPSVLEQQKALNKLGAGLVEDGITGPKTREAIAKYANAGATPTPTPTSAPAPAQNQQPAPQAQTPAPAPQPAPQPAPLTTAGQVPNVLDRGNQTENERETQRQLEEAGAITEWEEAVKSGMAVEEANKRLSDFRMKMAEKYGNIESTAIPLEFQQGRAQVLGRQFASQESALQAGLTNALANQQQQFTASQAQAQRGATTTQGAYTGAQTQAGRGLLAGSTALGAVAPQFPGYGQQIIQPGLLGQFGGGGGSLQDAVSTVIQRLQQGTMSYNDAVSALSGYGQGGLNALQQALPPGFNIAQSNTLAGQQGSIGVNYQLAETALKNVENLIAQLSASQRTNVPAINKGANWISTQFGIGSEKTRAVTGAVQSLRNAYASLLASVKGGTPTDYSSQAVAEIPNEPTPNDIKAVRANFEVLGKARKEILGNPGQAGSPSGSSGGGFGWDALNY